MTLRNVIVMLVLAALAVLAWLSLGGRDGDGTRLPPTLPEFTKNEVSKIVATAHDRKMTFHRRTDRSDAWDVEEGPALVRADTNAVDELLTLLARQAVQTRFEIARQTEGDVQGKEIEQTKISVELTAAGKTQLVRFGKRTREGGGVYVDTGPGTDIWVVTGGVPDHLVHLFTEGARSKRLTDLRVYDLSKVEIVAGGVTRFQAERSGSQIWNVTQPYRGFADAVAFEQWAGKLCNVEVESWVRIDEPDLKKWGLAEPRMEVVLTPKTGAEASTILVGDAPDGGGVHVLEKGRNNVGLAPEDFRKAVETDPATLRDASFSRIGIDGVALKVKVGDAAYELRKEGRLWDLTAPIREPADQDAVRAVLERLRSWRTVEFLDSAKPEDHGISEGCDFVEVEHLGTPAGGQPPRTTILLGPDTGLPDGTRYAQRKSPEGEGGVERVEGAIVQDLAKGYLQFRRKTVVELLDWLPDLRSVARDGGSSEEGKAVETMVVEKDANDRWVLSATRGPGAVGELDPAAVHQVVSALGAVYTQEWLFWSPEKNEEMGFVPPVAETLSIELEFSGRTGQPKVGLKPRLLVGRKRPEGGYFARFLGDEEWAFVLSEDDVKKLSTPFVRPK